jgi:K+-transporting ATPase A subunit
MMLVTWFRKYRKMTTLLFLLQIMLISNALVCSFAGTLHARLQGRISWLTVFCVLLGILTVFGKRPSGENDRLPKFGFY